MIVWTKKAEDDFTARHGRSTRKAGSEAWWGNTRVADDNDLMEAFACREWIADTSEPHACNADVYNRKKRLDTLRATTIVRAENRWLMLLHLISLGIDREEISRRQGCKIKQLHRWTTKWRPYFADKYGDVDLHVKKGR